jgi:parvulin-like peptidyl-prolyl isomerase
MKKWKIGALALAMSFVLASCAGGSKDALVSIGSESYSQAEFQFYVDNMKEQMASDADIEKVKEKAYEMAVDDLETLAVAKKLKLKMTETEKSQAKKAVTQMLSSYGGEDALKEKGISKSFVQKIYDANIYNKKLNEKVSKEESVSDDEMKAYFDQNYRRAKHVLFLTKDMETGEEYSEEQAAEAQKKAQDTYAKALTGSDFDSLVEELSEDPGSKSSPDGYVFTDGDMVDEFADAVDAVNPGGVIIAKSSFGYHVIKRLALDETPELYSQFFEENKQQIQTHMTDDKVEEKMQGWLQEYGLKLTRNDELYNAVQ